MGGRTGGERWHQNQIFLAMGLRYKVLMYFWLSRKNLSYAWKGALASVLLSIVTGIGRARTMRPLQSSPKILETPLHVPFPLQCWDVIAKSRVYINTAKGEGKKIEQNFPNCFKAFAWDCLKRWKIFWSIRKRLVVAPSPAFVTSVVMMIYKFVQVR